MREWACGHERLESLRLEGAQIAPQGRRVLEGVTLECEPGELCAIVGNNGAGKTSLLRVMAGLDELAVGTMQLAGRSIGSWKGKALGKRRAYMEQSGVPEFDYSIGEVVMMGEYAWRAGWGPAGEASYRRALEYLERVGCEGLVSQSVMRCSGGELQRVMLARVMATRAGWWMLDEPLASLDMKYQGVVMDVLGEHCARGGGVVMVCHDVNWVLARCQKVVVCHGGEVRHVGVPCEVLTRELVREVFGVEVEEYGEGARKRIVHQSFK